MLDRIRSRMSATQPGGGSSALGNARARLQQRLPPGSWAALSKGRMQLALLPSIFRSYSEIEQSLTRLLGQTPVDVHVAQYKSKSVTRACVTAKAGERRALLIVDAQGKVESEAVAR